MNVSYQMLHTNKLLAQCSCCHHQITISMTDNGSERFTDLVDCQNCSAPVFIRAQRISENSTWQVNTGHYDRWTNQWITNSTWETMAVQ